MWIFIWLLLSAFILGIFIWSMAILHQQKKTWKKLADSAGLTYVSGGFTGAPSLTGKIRDFDLRFYTEAQPTEDARGQRYVTVLEFELGGGMPTGAALATPEYEAFLSGLKMNKTFKPDHPDWQDDYIIKTRDADLAKEYLNEQRLQTLVSIFNMKNSICIFFFDEIDAVLRLETSDPLRNYDHMKRIVKRLIAALETLKATEEEREHYKDRREIAEEREKARQKEIEEMAQQRAERRREERELASKETEEGGEKEVEPEEKSAEEGRSRKPYLEEKPESE